MLFGGESTEHDISIASAKNVARALDSAKYDIVFGLIDTSGRWWHVDEITKQKPDDATALHPVLGQRAFIVDGEVREFDVILPVLHGPNGEDGSVQALAQLLHIPIVGCDMTASAVAMNKYITKQIAKSIGVPIVDCVVHRAPDELPSYEHITERLNSIIFVKPAGAGSSVGVSKVTNQSELDAAIKEAHQYDELVLIEKAVDARELEVAVLGNYPGVKTSVVGEIKPDREFYSYESKYDQSSSSQVVIPAEISQEVSETIKGYALHIFEAIGGSGLSRVDFFLTKEGQIYFNELNSIPGFTDISMYSKLWQYEGVEYADLIDTLIMLARDSTIKEKEK
jgi:D-alanine-D-alanine ligase